VDLLIGVDCANLHDLFVDICGNVGEPVARLLLGPLMVERNLEQEHTPSERC